MKSIWILSIVLVVLLLSQLVYSFPAKVIKVIDGDTIDIIDNSHKQERIRLYGVDAPEKKQAFGQASRKMLASIIAGKTVEIEAISKDRYGRTVGIITTNGINTNQEMLRTGMAWVYPQFCKRVFCKAWYVIQKIAREEKTGLWRDSSPIPPWKWRKR